jgi:hypothetical protein
VNRNENGFLRLDLRLMPPSFRAAAAPAIGSRPDSGGYMAPRSIDNRRRKIGASTPSRSIARPVMVGASSA